MACSQEEVAEEECMKLSVPWVDEAEWQARTNPDREAMEAINDPVWRVANLYWIRDPWGKVIPFVPTPEQRVIIWDLLVRLYRNEIILKSRKIGFSTVLGVICADIMAFNTGVEIALVDKTKDDAERKLENIVEFAINSLPDEFRKALTKPDGLDNKSTIGVWSGRKEDTPSRMDAGVSFRGGTPQILWVSEWATIQFEQPVRSTEIKTGAMEAARYGVRLIETTWKGGKGGDVYDYVQQANRIAEEHKSQTDWRLRFFPWWVDTKNVEYGSEYAMRSIDAETHKYLDDKEAELEIRFTPEQRLWYFNRKMESKGYMRRENPTTLEECWSTPVEGAIYADLIERLRGESKVVPFERSPDIAVDTFWDLGSPQNTCVWYVQRLGRGQFDIIDCDFGLNLTTEERVRHMHAKGYQYEAHYIPHDGAADQKGGRSFQDELMMAGLQNVRVVPRTRDIEVGIDAVRRMLLGCRFHAERCKDGVESLENYRAKVDDKKFRSENIVHDVHSHPADAFRTIAEAAINGMLSGQGGRRFDVEGVKVLDDKAKLAAGTVVTGTVIVQDYGAMFLKAEPAESWLAMAQRPQMGRFYVLAYAALYQRHVWAVLRAEFTPDMEPIGGYVAAASLGDGLMDADIAARRVADTSQYFGTCLVVTVADDPEATWRCLVGHGCDRVFKRPKSVLTKTQQQIGWSASDDCAEPMANLARRIREEQLDVFHEPARQQLQQFMRQPGGKVGAMAGYGDEWVRALAVGCQCLPLGTPFHPGEQRRANPAALVIAPVDGRISSF